jgi:hypothetical protein
MFPLIDGEIYPLLNGNFKVVQNGVKPYNIDIYGYEVS